MHACALSPGAPGSRLNSAQFVEAWGAAGVWRRACPPTLPRHQPIRPTTSLAWSPQQVAAISFKNLVKRDWGTGEESGERPCGGGWVGGASSPPALGIMRAQHVCLPGRPRCERRCRPRARPAVLLPQPHTTSRRSSLTALNCTPHPLSPRTHRSAQRARRPRAPWPRRTKRRCGRRCWRA